MNAVRFSVADLRCEYQRNPLGIAVQRPRFGWKLVAADPTVRDLSQSAFRIQVTTSPEFEENALLWDTGVVQSDTSVQHAYGGAPLAPRTRYFWRVQVWDNQGAASAWSESAWWEMGLAADAWQGVWIAPAIPDDASRSNPAPYLRREFSVRAGVRRARLYATAQGLYEIEINGRRFDDELFRPGWTSYHKRIQYQTWDVTDALQEGANALGVILGDGWYRGSLGWGEGRNVYGRELALLLQLHLDYADGSEEIVSSSTDGWTSATGALLLSDIYHGETYDARLEPIGWSQTGFDDSGWAGVRALDSNVGEIVAQYGPSVTRQEVLQAQEITTSPEGEVILDLGQNMVGWARLRVKGKAGDAVTLRFAEVLNPDGSLYVANLRSAKAIDTYILRGDENEEVWEPRFTYHGFRYIGVSGYPGEVAAESVVGVVLHSEMDTAGSFSCSNPLINQLQSNIQWGQKGNFLEVPTDCPQRDERMGWTGDAQVFARTALFNRRAAAFYTRWLRDLAADQNYDGAVTHVVPDVLNGAGAAAWGDAAAIVPWNLYLAEGDTRILEEQYDSIVAWVEYIRARAGADLIWRSGFVDGFTSNDLQFGDWVAVEAQDEKFPHPVTSYAYLCTAFFAYSTGLLAKIAQILGREEDALHYGALVPRIHEALAREFITPNGRIDGNTQTDYVLALHFGLLPADARAAAAERLANEVRRFDNHLSTGFVGTPYLCHVLSRFGHHDLAFAVLETETWPGWLYTVTRGATTMWERWDSIRPDGSFGNVSMNSFNHYAYGAIGDWLYQVVAGIDVDSMAPGYKRAIIAPRPGGSLTWARASHESPYGAVSSAWNQTDGVFALEATVPPNAEGVVRLPAAAIRDVTEGGRALSDVEGVHAVRLLEDEGVVEVSVGSGTYRFLVAAS